ncbi:MAG: AbrB family transcriptional regulator [Chloroflexi bacterium]|nr:AbrB family transcriptional regulator [Chloroflexota bacterium]
MISDFINVVIILLVALASWWLAERVRFPAPSILGPMIGIAIVAGLGMPHPEVPSFVRVLVQSVIGGTLGLKIDRKTVASTRAMILPIGGATIWFTASSLLIGYLLARLAAIDLYTSFLGTAPGGVAEMTAMAMSVQADVAFVATLQTVRLLTSNLSIPILARYRARNNGHAQPITTPAAENGSPTGLPWVVCLTISAVGGFAFDALQVPAGGVIGAMVVVASVQLARVQLQAPPLILRNVAQLGIGILVGIAFTPETVASLIQALGIVIATTIATVLSAMILAYFVTRWLCVDAQTAMLACAPGGLSLMPVIADEVGAQSFIVSLFQLARIVVVILLMPFIFRMLV